MLPVWVTYSPASCKLVGTIRTHFQNLLQRNQILTNHRIIAALLRQRCHRSLNLSPETKEKNIFHHQKWVQSLSLPLSNKNKKY